MRMKKKKQRENFQVSNLNRKAEQGDADAQFNLAVLYYYGDGVPQDYAKARQWWEQAAAQGHADAQYNLGQLYFFWHGVPQDLGKRDSGTSKLPTRVMRMRSTTSG